MGRCLLICLEWALSTGFLNNIFNGSAKSLSKNSVTQGNLCTIFVSYTGTILQTLFCSFLAFSQWQLSHCASRNVCLMPSFWSTCRPCSRLKKSNTPNPSKVPDQVCRSSIKCYIWCFIILQVKLIPFILKFKRIFKIFFKLNYNLFSYEYTMLSSLIVNWKCLVFYTSCGRLHNFFTSLFGKLAIINTISLQKQILYFFQTNDSELNPVGTAYKHSQTLNPPKLMKDAPAKQGPIVSCCRLHTTPSQL